MNLSTSETMLYSTVKITSILDGNVISTGTGFYSEFSEDEKKLAAPIIVTNKHVVAGADSIQIAFYVADAGASEPFDDSSKELMVMSFRIQNWLVEHPDPNIDLCAIAINPILTSEKLKDKMPFIIPIPMGFIPNDEDWQYLDAIEKVTMIGYPNGLSDEVNNYPIVRQGITATSASKLYNGKPEFMVDMACFPGSSGSPVFLYNNGEGYTDRKTGAFILSGQRILLLGILYAGPKITDSGQIILSRNPQFTFSSMMHLGYVIRSSELNGLKSAAREKWLGNS